MKAIIVGINPADAYYPIKENLIGKVIHFNSSENIYSFRGSFEIPDGHLGAESEKLYLNGYAYSFDVEVIDE